MFPKYAWIDSLLSEKECAFVIEKGKELMERANTANNNPDDYRVGSVGWFLKGEDTDLDLILERVIDGFGWTVYEHFYGAKIKGVEPIQFTHYQEGDYFDWHYDAIEHSERPLRVYSASLELTNPESYSGGGLEFHTLEQTIPDRALGRLVVFPSLLLHRARKVESGERSSLVLWASM